jgi:uncharacterized protein DUF4386
MCEREMKGHTLSKLGGTCSIFVGVSYIVAAAVYLLAPVKVQDAAGIPPGQFLETLAQNSTGYTVPLGIAALDSLLTIAVILAISESVQSANPGWVRWTSNLAIVGSAVNAVEFLDRIVLNPARAAAYVHGDAAVRAALTVPGALAGLDPQAWLRYGAVGVWILVVSVLALRGNIWPKSLAYVGIGVAIAYCLIVATNLLQVQLFTAIVAGVGGVILFPVWYIWLGVRLRRAS